MTRLISVEDIASKLDLGKKPDNDKLNPIIDQAQDVELRDFLGKHFYFDVLANNSNPIYQELLSGGTFSLEGVEYYQDGLKTMLMDLFFARFVVAVSTNITPFGATVKLNSNNNSEPASPAVLKEIALQYRQSAGSKWEIIKLYLDTHKTLFPNYNYKADTIETGERKLKYWRIK